MRRFQGSTSRAAQAFTLVELLVVIGIIALLISILLPSLNRARAAANDIKCLSNLRTLGQACQAYINDNRGVLPPVVARSTSYYRNWWPQALTSTKYVTTTSFGDSTATANAKATNNVFTCPSGNPSSWPGFENGNVGSIAGLQQTQDFAQHNFIGRSADNYPLISTNYMANGLQSYSSNWGRVVNGRQLGDYFPFSSPPSAAYLTSNPTIPDSIPTRMTGVRETTKIVLLSDGYVAHDRSPNLFTLRHGNLKGTFNQRRCNMVFLDGHADSIAAFEMPNQNLDTTMAFNTFNSTNILNTDAAGRWTVRLLAKRFD